MATVVKSGTIRNCLPAPHPQLLGKVHPSLRRHPRRITAMRQAEGAEMRQQLEPFITVRKGDVSAQRRG